MSDVARSSLFSPIKIGNTLFKNRIFSSPTGHPDMNNGIGFTDDVIAYFERKAIGGAAAVSLGEAAVDSVRGLSYPAMLGLDKRTSGGNLSRLTDTVRRHGAVPSIELQHPGMELTIEEAEYGVSLLPEQGDKVLYAPSAQYTDGVEFREMPEEMIVDLIGKFAAAAAFAKHC